MLLHRRVVVGLCLVFVLLLAATVILPVLPFFILENDGKSPIWISWAIVTHAIGSIIGAPILGSLSDRVGPFKVIWPSILVEMIGYVVLACIELFPAWPVLRLTIIILVRFMTGFCLGIVGVLLSYILQQSKNYHMAMTGFVMAETIGVLTGFGVGSQIANEGFTVICIIVASLLGVLWLVSLVEFRNAVNAQQDHISFKDVYRNVIMVLSSKGRIAVFGQLFLFNMAFSAYQSTHALFLSDRFFVHAEQFGEYLLVFGVCTLIGQCGAPFLLRFISPPILSVLGVLWAAGWFVLLPFIDNLVLSVCTFSLGNFGVGLTSACILVVLVQFTDEDVGGTVMGGAVCATSLGQIVGSMLFSEIYVALGVMFCYVLSAGFVAISSLLVPSVWFLKRGENYMEKRLVEST